MAELLKKLSIDPACLEAIAIAQEKGISTAWEREALQSPHCKFGELGVCCRICDMGPCRKVGVCGADTDTIVARNLLRQIAAGASAHSDHGRDIAITLLRIAEGEAEGYEIRSPAKLLRLAQEWGIKIDGRKLEEIAKDVALKALNQWGQQEGELLFPSMRPPAKTVETWRKYGIMPRGIDREIVEALHRTHEGVDADYRNLIMHGLRTALSDGWAGSMIATDLSDIIFGEPAPIRSKVNFGVLKEDEVNIVVHGHEPTLSEMIVKASYDKELLDLARKVGAKGINVAGICCTANEILMRQGAVVVGNFLNQELAIATGAVDVMLVDVQCIMPALSEHVNRFHTKLITTSPKARIKNATHIQFEEEKAYSIAREIVKIAIENYKNRKEVKIPQHYTDLIAGFTMENIFHHLGGRYRASYRPLNEAIIYGRLRGLAAVVGCNTVRKIQDESIITMVKELLINDVLVVVTGCAAVACAKIGLLQPESAKVFAGKGLQEICEAVGIPPVLHLGACVDNSRILTALTEVVKEGGLGEKIADLPVAAAAPEAMSEKAIAIAFYAVATGCFVAYNPPMKVLGSENITKFITEELENIVGGKLCFECDPKEASHRMLDHIDKKRKALKLRPLMYQVPYKPKIN